MPIQRQGFLVVGAITALSCSVIGAGQTFYLKAPEAPRISLGQPGPEKHETAPEVNAREEPPEPRLTTDEDIQQSIDEFQKLSEQAQQIISENQNAKNNDHPPVEAITKQIANWRERQDAWKTSNDRFIEWSQLWLGADGTDTNPKPALAFENLKRGNAWLSKSVDEVLINHSSESEIYLAGARKSLEQARGLLSGKIKPNRRKALLKTPRAIAALEKKQSRELPHD